jgi:methionine aminopeptidase
VVSDVVSVAVGVEETGEAADVAVAAPVVIPRKRSGCL